ncbi:MAG TPA: response regulator transcription factor [Leptolyngbyaceae cyanobacterium M33_DOE_097]|uniref:Response regulator transcription factor n=1 Tax=Oscillatoriales cyanobacterium SpSt-418 TaxID=2282169 RepID=A0A7C3PG02_9CYAN|nr:response regulator transcription factor [Leptolyngbyaceae cyanobacterium M33_DOE_097]
MRILLVEDDADQLEPLHAALSQAGHIVDGIRDGAIAQWIISQRDYDLLILDWLLPQVNGLNLCRQYRHLGKTAPVLILTAKDTTTDKVSGLDAGADDYLVKPADVFELLARVRALGRRSPLWKGDTLHVEDLTLYLPNLTVERGEQSLQLSTREFQLLEYFMRHPRQVLSRNQIEQVLWEWGTEPESNAITTLVRRVRQRLQAVGVSDWLETVYGMGYRLNPNVQS